jgi:7-carboxy-7-deazaguanine synthase
MPKTTIPVSEIFPAVQGEGPLLGKPTVFVRTGGCDYRCAWCDSLHAVLPEHKDEWTPMTPAEIMGDVLALTHGQPIIITLSGGNPAIHTALGDFVALAQANRCQVAIETQGSVARPWFAALDYVVLSPKPPSSGMVTHWGHLRKCVEAAQGAPTFLKVVVFDDLDYEYARNVARMFPLLPFYLQVGNHTPSAEVDTAGLLARLRWLTEKVLADRWYTAIITPQMHTLIYGNERGR